MADCHGFVTDLVAQNNQILLVSDTLDSRQLHSIYKMTAPAPVNYWSTDLMVRLLDFRDFCAICGLFFVLNAVLCSRSKSTGTAAMEFFASPASTQM